MKRKMKEILPYILGFLVGAGIICAFLAGVALQKILIAILLLLVIVFYGEKMGRKGKDEF